MAKATWIVERVDTRRPCLTTDGLKCLFHCWSNESWVVEPSPMIGGHPGGVVSTTFAILEFEDGHLEKVRPEKFTFSDGGQFKQWAWNSDNECLSDKGETK